MSEDLVPPPPPNGSLPAPSVATASKKSKTPLVVGIVLLVVIVAVAGVFVLGGGDDKSTNDAAAVTTVISDSDPTTESTPKTATTANTGASTDASTTIPMTAAPAATTTTLPPSPWLSSWNYWSVPSLTADDVRGSGCGSGLGADVSIGDTYPDGVWFGALGSYEDTEYPTGAYGPLNRWYSDHLEIDGYCVYSGSLGEQKYQEAGCLSGDFECYASGDFWMENQNVRFRSIPVSPTVLYEAGTNEYLTDCTRDDRTGLNAAWRFNPVWIVIQGGVVTEIHADCYFTP